MRYKKGVTLSMMITIIIAALALIVIISFFSDVQAGVHKVTRDKACLSTITIKTKSTIEYGPGDIIKYENTMDVNCPSYQVIFNDKKGQILRWNGEEWDNYEDISYKHLPDDKLNAETVNRVIADEMLYCWDKFGAGQIDAFFVPTNWFQDLVNSENKEGIIGCRVCAEIHLNLTEYQEFEGFNEFIKDTNKTAFSTSYYEQIAETDRYCGDKYKSLDTNCWEKFAEENDIDTNPVFKSDQEYLVVFVRESMIKNKGTLNTYVMDLDTKNEVCQTTLPFT